MLNDLFQASKAEINFAEGWLSSGESSLYFSGWASARFHGYPFLQRPIKALVIASDMKRRGLYRGFDLRTLDE